VMPRVHIDQLGLMVVRWCSVVARMSGKLPDSHGNSVTSGVGGRQQRLQSC
jgi:hypothetical protein